MLTQQQSKLWAKGTIVDRERLPSTAIETMEDGSRWLLETTGRKYKSIMGTTTEFQCVKQLESLSAEELENVIKNRRAF